MNSTQPRLHGARIPWMAATDRSQVLVLCICFGVITAEGAITTRLLPLYALHLGADPFAVGLMVGSGFLAVTLGNIVGGWVSDRVGRQKLILLIGLGAWIPVTLSMVLATDVYWLTVTSGLGWVAGGIALAMTNNIVALLAAKSERGKVFGWMSLAAGAGMLLVGVAAGPYAERWGFPALFVGMAAVNVVMLILVASIREREPLRRPSQSCIQGYCFGGGTLALLLAAHLLARLGQLVGVLAVPLMMARLGYDATAVSSTITVSAAATLPLPLILGRLSDNVGRKGVLTVCYGLSAAGVLLMLYGLELWQFWLAVSLIAITEASGSTMRAFITDIMPLEALGRTMSFLSSISLVAGVLALGGGGYMMHNLGASFTLILGTCLQVTAVLAILCLRRPPADLQLERVST